MMSAIKRLLIAAIPQNNPPGPGRPAPGGRACGEMPVRYDLAIIALTASRECSSIFPICRPGWPWSLWFFAATLAVYLLQRFPLTGVFLMVVGAAFWSIILVNLGVIGIGAEALTGRVSRLWLLVPLLYFGGYYWLYSRDQAALAGLRAEYERTNQANRSRSTPPRRTC